MSNVEFYTNNLQRDLDSFLEAEWKDYWDYYFASSRFNVFKRVFEQYIFPVPRYYREETYTTKCKVMIRALKNNDHPNVSDLRNMVHDVDGEMHVRIWRKREKHKKELLQFGVDLLTNRNACGNNGGPCAMEKRAPKLLDRLLRDPMGMDMLRSSLFKYIKQYVDGEGYAMSAKHYGDDDDPNEGINLLLQLLGDNDE